MDANTDTQARARTAIARGAFGLDRREAYRRITGAGGIDQPNRHDAPAGRHILEKKDHLTILGSGDIAMNGHDTWRRHGRPRRLFRASARRQRQRAQQRDEDTGSKAL